MAFDTPWIGEQAKKLYLQSGQFTSTIKDSEYVGGIDTYPWGISWDDSDTLWNAANIDRHYLMSGQFTSTIKASKAVLGGELAPTGISWDGTNTPWAGLIDIKLFLTSGKFTSTLKTSRYVGGINLYLHGISYDGTNTPWTGSNSPASLFLTSGQFTSTIKTSQAVYTIDLDPKGISWDGINTLWTGLNDRKLYLTSGQFTSTIKTSRYVGGIDTLPYDIETNNLNGRLGIVPEPDPPTVISVVEGEGQNTINFTVDPEADETHIYWANSPGVTIETGTKISDVSSPHIHDDLNPSLTYYYILTSENEEGEGDPSSEYSGSPIPEPPENVIAISGIEKNTISFNSSTGADSYNIYWKNTPGVTKGNGTKITGVTSPREHLSLTPELPYYYIVTAEDEDGESSESLEVSGTPVFPIPDAPENPTIVILESGDSENVITYDNSIGAVSYNLYWSTDSDLTIGNGTKIEGITKPYSHRKLTKGKYYYIITAVNAQGEGDASDIVNGPISFDGKEFEHITIMLRKILQQYKD